MKEVLLKDIPIEFDIELLIKELCIKEDTEKYQRLQYMVKDAAMFTQAKALYKEAFVDEVVGDSVIINGTNFQSKVLGSNLEDIGRVFIFAGTCGTEIELWSKQFDDILEKFWADAIKQTALFMVMEYMVEHIKNTYELGEISFMNPGSLPDWPISQQEPLFSLLGDLENKIGVKLTKSFLMSPVKSVSGILFPNDNGYVNCKLCVKKNCPSRRAPFDAQMYREKLG